MIAIRKSFGLWKILVPLDATAASVTAWRTAKDLAAATGATVEGLYVESFDGTSEMPPSREYRDKVLSGIVERLGNGGEEIGSVWGPVEDTIVSWTKNLDYDLVVMGTHARRGLSRLFNGSVAEAVIRESRVPVLVVRRRLPALRRILAPVCFEPHDKIGLDAAASLALAVGARLTLLHVVSGAVYGGPGSGGPKRVLDAQLARLPAEVRAACRPQGKLAFGEPAEKIAEAAQETDLVVLTAHDRRGLAENALGTTAERLLRRGAAAVLAVPGRVREAAAA